ncbi:MAG TPA: LLM class flavin-dependent oxidoreductase [Trebonia sp.]
MSTEFLFYIPNTVETGIRGDDVQGGWADLDLSSELARITEEHGWSGALIGTSWGRPDTFTVATSLAARTTTFKPLIATRPGYWRPAHFATAAATLDHLSGGRVLVNIVSGQDDLAAYGDTEGSREVRYARTKEFMRLVRRLWTEENVTFRGAHFSVENSTITPRPFGAADGRHPRLYFGGASPEAEQVSVTEADVQLFWGEPLEGIASRVDRLTALSGTLGRDLAPLEFGLRITTVVRETSDEAWNIAQDRVAKMAAGVGVSRNRVHLGSTSIGQRRLVELAERGDVLDTCLYTAPGKAGGGGAATTWLVGSFDEVAAALHEYAKLGVTHFILSDAPYKTEAARIGDSLLPRLRALLG